MHGVLTLETEKKHSFTGMKLKRDQAEAWLYCSDVHVCDIVFDSRQVKEGDHIFSCSSNK